MSELYNQYILYEKISWGIGTFIGCVFLWCSVRLMKFCYREWKRERAKQSNNPGWEIPMVICGVFVAASIFLIGVCKDGTVSIGGNNVRDGVTLKDPNYLVWIYDGMPVRLGKKSIKQFRVINKKDSSSESQ